MVLCNCILIFCILSMIANGIWGCQLKTRKENSCSKAHKQERKLQMPSTKLFAYHLLNNMQNKQVYSSFSNTKTAQFDAIFQHNFSQGIARTLKFLIQVFMKKLMHHHAIQLFFFGQKIYVYNIPHHYLRVNKVICSQLFKAN